MLTSAETNRLKAGLLVISGPSGVGKSSAERALCGRLGLWRLISHTTREKREGEQDGVDYFYTSAHDFERMIQMGRMAESADFGGNSYGLPWAQLQRGAEHKGATFVATPRGLLHLSDVLGFIPRAVWLDADTPTLARRMVSRGDAQGKINARLSGIESERFMGRVGPYLHRLDTTKMSQCEVVDALADIWRANRWAG